VQAGLQALPRDLGAGRAGQAGGGAHLVHRGGQARRARGGLGVAPPVQQGGHVLQRLQPGRAHREALEVLQ